MPFGRGKKDSDSDDSPGPLSRLSGGSIAGNGVSWVPGSQIDHDRQSREIGRTQADHIGNLAEAMNRSADQQERLADILEEGIDFVRDAWQDALKIGRDVADAYIRRVDHETRTIDSSPAPRRSLLPPDEDR